MRPAHVPESVIPLGSRSLTAAAAPWLPPAEEPELRRPPAPPVALNSAAPAASNPKDRDRTATKDQELIEQSRAGDMAAFGKLVERHQRRVFALAYGLVRDEQDARDIAQEAFLRVHKGLATFQGGSSFFTWLYRIVTNLSIDLLRRPARREAEFYLTLEGEDGESPYAAPASTSDPFDVVRRGELAICIQRALDALPPYHRGVILMREVEGMSYEEMAEAMHVSKGTIMSRLFHARKKLQRALADLRAEECEDTVLT